MLVSVVMPTHNRADVLLRTLELYRGQTGLCGGFELILIDDASDDDTPAVLRDAQGGAFDLVKRRLPVNGGPSVARNLALDLARGDVVLFTGDDMLPAPDFVARHLEFHREQPEETAAMVGNIRWADDLAPTPLLSWLERNGTQFHYGDMRDGAVVTPDRFYTGNVSVKRSFLDRTGLRFDPRLRFCEDGAFGTQLARAGMVLQYRANARVQHLHPTDLASSLRRMEALGRALAAIETPAPETFARATGGVLDRNAGWRGRAVRLALAAPFGRWVYRPLAALCERRVFADRIFALAHASTVLSSLLSARRAGSGTGMSGPAA
jgi:glycosyltransferase involved in cell wall biosynthesis